MAQIILATCIGIFTSLLGWWIVSRAFLPRIEPSSKISKAPDEHRDNPWAYRIKLVNIRRWPLRLRPVVDVKIVLTLQVLGLDSSRPKKWNDYNIPVANGGEFPVLTYNRLVRIRSQDIMLEDRPMLVSHLQAEDPEMLDLDRLLALGVRSRLRLTVRASSAYTHATTTKIYFYAREDVLEGLYRVAAGRAGLEIVPPSQESSARPEATNEDPES